MAGRETKKDGTGKGERRNLLDFLLPDSLFAQLFLLFSCCFFLILFLVVFNNSLTRQEFLQRGVMLSRTWRVAELALMVDTASLDDRPRVAARMSGQGMELRVVNAPPNLRGMTPESLMDFADQYRQEVNRALLDVWYPPGGPQNGGEPAWRFSQAPFSLDARVAVHEVSSYSVWEDLKNFFRLERRPPDEESPVYTATLVIPLSQVNWLVIEDSPAALNNLGRIPLAGIVAVEAFFLILSLLVIFLVVRPLRQLTRATESFGRDLIGSPPVPESGPKEIREAAQAFNAMQRRVRQSVEDRSRTLAAVSHDLRTPLTRMRLRVEQLDEDQRLPLQKDMDELQQLMDTTIDLAGANSTEGMVKLDIASLLESLVEDYQDLGHDVRFIHNERLLGLPAIKARPLSVKRCLTNVLENAIRYGGGQVRVSIMDSPYALSIYVQDNGPGIPEEDRERVFDTFYRLEPSRNRETGGSGLGLSIARTMARAHGGDIVLGNRPEGGLQAEIILPRQQSEQKREERARKLFKSRNRKQ